jgi:hypothetical protein
MKRYPTAKREKVYLLPLGETILEHWRKYRPQMCKELEREGKLLQTVESVQNQVIDTTQDLHEKKVPWATIQEVTREMWALPAEEDKLAREYEHPTLTGLIPPETTG